MKSDIKADSLKQSRLLTILFSILSCILWGFLLAIIFKDPILTWLRPTALHNSNQTAQIPVLTEGPVEITHITDAPTQVMSDKERLEQIAVDAIEYYAYDLLFYPVSQNKRLPETYPTTDAQLPLVTMGDVTVAEIIAEPLADMMAAAKSAGYSPYLRSGFRSINDQYTAYSRYVADAVTLGMNLSEAREYASEFSAVPGYSEHHLGLAVDLLDYAYSDWIISRNNYDKGLYLWLRQHAHEFGFVISYPTGTTTNDAKLGSGYPISEPWHLRFVGNELARWLFNAGYLDPQTNVTVNGTLNKIYDRSVSVNTDQP
jgi:LAS superfamily LD-carboxypeptidase LdcB